MGEGEREREGGEGQNGEVERGERLGEIHIKSSMW